MPTVNSRIGSIDTFHHGGQLSPGQAFGKGKHLFTDLYVLHGAGEDILVPFMTLHLPGTAPGGGVGSFFFVVTALETIGAMVFVLFLARCLRPTGLFLLASS